METGRELSALLAASDEEGAAVSGAIPEEKHELTGEVESLPIGRRLGPWEVERQLGHGGMGAVFLVRRADGAFEQRAALKLIRPGLASMQLVRRFRDERQVLASLDHPNIARLLDGGATDDGLPFLVMEYVEGTTIEEHCDRHALDLPARLELFLLVCAGVEHAHRRLVVHRDLKPSNVLVTAAGVPKLLDFGIAKLIGPQPGEETQVLTQAMFAIGTFAYASPEQLLNGPVSTATDVYSLGVMLYRLLAGRHPYALDGLPLTKSLRMVCDVVPPPPSRAVLAAAGGAAERARAHVLRGDLDNIVLKALRKDPEGRYPSVAAFADDLRRHRDGLPVTARRGSLRYRAGKFVRRHRWGVAAAGLLLATLLAGLAGTTWQAHRALEAARRAELERQKAEQVSDFLERAFAAPNVGWRVRGGAKVTVLEVLAGAGERLERDLAGQPAVEAHLHHVLGETYAVLTQSQLAKHHVERALALDRRLYGESHRATARAYALLGWIYGGHLGEFRRGTALMDHALDLYARLPAPPPDDYAETLAARSTLAVTEGQLERAMSLAQRGVAMARRAGPANPILPQALYRLAATHDARGDIAAAEKGYREAIAAFDRLPQPDIPERAQAELDLGGLLVTRRELAAAEPLLRAALDAAVRHLGADNPSAPILLGHLYLGRLAEAKGDFAAAEAEIRRALAILDANELGTSYAARMAQLYLGRALLEARRLDAADRALSQAYEYFRSAPGFHTPRAQTETALGSCRVAQGRYAEAEPLLLAAERTLEASQVETSPRLRASIQALVTLYDRWGKRPEHERWAARLPASTRAP